MFHSSSSTFTTTSSSSFRDATLFPPASCTTATHAVDGAPPRGFIDVSASGFLPLLPSSASSAFSLLPRSLPRSSSSHLLPVYHPTTHPLKQMPFSFPPEHQPRRQNPPPALASQSTPPSSSSSSSSSSCDFPHFKACPVRRVFSTGDLQRLTGMVVSGENHNQEGGEIAAKAARYKPEERKERIVRYRSRRKHRNFHKKITVHTVPFHPSLSSATPDISCLQFVRRTIPLTLLFGLTVRVQEDISRQPATGEGQVREERRDRREGGGGNGCGRDQPRTGGRRQRSG
ncbi:CCT motif [Musa troglodytarum]|uniref:CCT motif n=1 Tax=Musa troglodytarum TaxID=320322 RepID=A0A9E7JU06_9LILI|nr:CCT motif [Musa troglodytarum]